LPISRHTDPDEAVLQAKEEFEELASPATLEIL